MTNQENNKTNENGTLEQKLWNKRGKRFVDDDRKSQSDLPLLSSLQCSEMFLHPLR